MLRRLPALCAGVMMLAACTDGDPVRTDRPTAPPVSTGAVTPGEIYPEYGRIADRVLFQTDSALLQSDAQQILEKQAAWLQAFPQHTVTIEGHADERGTREYNLALGEKRAQAVKDYLVALGIDPKRLKTISYGKERPACSEATADCWSRNRRTVTKLDNG